MNNKIIKKINEFRQTVKAYSKQEIPAKDWEDILSSIYWSPTSFGFEPYRVLIINRNSELRKELMPLMWKQGVVCEADKLIFFISLKYQTFSNSDWVEERAKRLGTKVLELKDQDLEDKIHSIKNGFLEYHIKTNEKVNDDDWAMKQCYIALSSALNAAALLGIGSTPIEGFQRIEVRNMFIEKGLIQKHETVAVAATFGYAKNEMAYSHFGKNNRVRDPWEVKFKTIE